MHSTIDYNNQYLMSTLTDRAEQTSRQNGPSPERGINERSLHPKAQSNTNITEDMESITEQL